MLRNSLLQNKNILKTLQEIWIPIIIIISKAAILKCFTIYKSERNPRNALDWGIQIPTELR